MCISNIIHGLFDACPADESHSPSVRAARTQMRLATTFQEARSDRAGDPNIVAIHRFFTLIEVGECVRLVKLTVKEVGPFAQRNALYTLEVVAVNDRAAAVEYIQAATREDGIDLGEERAPSGGSEQSR